MGPKTFFIRYNNDYNYLLEIVELNLKEQLFKLTLKLIIKLISYYTQENQSHNSKVNK